MEPKTCCSQKTVGIITEYSLHWQPASRGESLPSCDCAQNCVGSTHELIVTDEFIYVTGQSMYQVAKFNHDGVKLEDHEMPPCSGPHGLMVDSTGNIWVSLEFLGCVVRLDKNGKIVETIDVNIYANGTGEPINPAPHAICLDKDGETIWFTGKRSSTVGKINPDRTVEHFELSTLGSIPIYLSLGKDGNIWGTELTGNCIFKVNTAFIKQQEEKRRESRKPEGTHATIMSLEKLMNTEKLYIEEYKIPTANSRPIAVIPDPEKRLMWFTEEAGRKIGRLDMDATDKATAITEFNVPVLQPNQVLAALAFDGNNNLWVQVYVDQNNPKPAGFDYIIKFDSCIRNADVTNTLQVPNTMYQVPTQQSVLHRIKPDAQGKNLWFTELNTDKLGRVIS